MSLVHHVSVASIDGFDREVPVEETLPEDIEGFTPIRRQVSYDVLFPPDTQALVEDKAGVPPYKVSAFKRGAQVLVTILACWLASGIVFGFAALKPVLISEGVYRSLCTEEELRDNVEVCSEQDLRLNLFFTVASITTNVSALPVGSILDRYGSRVCGFVGCVLVATGSLLMAYSFGYPVGAFDGFVAANFFLALGGTFIFVPSFQIANAFPKHAGTIVAFVTGAFDASAAVYLVYRIAYEATAQQLKPKFFFLCYLLVPLLIFLALVTFMPRRDYQTMGQLELKVEKAQDPTADIHSSDEEISSAAELRRVRKRRAERRRSKIQKIDDIIGDEEERKQRIEQESERHSTSLVWGALHGLPAHKQMLTPWFVLITLMTVLQMLRMNYFIATIRAQYTYMLDSEAAAARINDFFDVAMPFVGVVSTPFIGFLLDHVSVPVVLAVIVVLTTAIGAFNSVPTAWAGYLTVVLFVVLRPLYYSAMSDYATKVFGFATFGRVYGAIICLSGLVNLSQYALDALTHGPFDGNPIPINATMAVAGFVIGSVLVTFVAVAGRRMKDEQEEQGDDEERLRLLIDEIPEEDEDDLDDE